MRRTINCLLLLSVGFTGNAGGQPADLKPLHVSIDMNVGEKQQVTLRNGEQITVQVVDLQENRDTIIGAVRRAEVTVLVNGERGILVSANYNLPKEIGGVQIDCPITIGYNAKSGRDSWGLDRAVRLRLWPAGSPWIQPGTIVYPAGQRWFATDTQMANEPTFVDGGEYPRDEVYYHNGLDIGGAEGRVQVFAATDGLVVSSGTHRAEGYENAPISPRHDVVYLLDVQGWYYRYSHLQSIVTTILPGSRVTMGQKIGVLGKEGASGGWSHLHFDITTMQPSGKWGTEEGYAFLWQSYVDQHAPHVIAVARPHHLARVGEPVTLDAGKSWCAKGQIEQYTWQFCDGGTATGMKIDRIYSKPGTYNELLKVTDNGRHSDWDYAVVQVINPDAEPALRAAPGIHALFYPSQNIQPRDPVTFLVRTFNAEPGDEVWDFGDGTPRQTVQSRPVIVSRYKQMGGYVGSYTGDSHDAAGYAATVHRFAQPGHYIVRVTRNNSSGYTVVGQVHVPVGVE